MDNASNPPRDRFAPLIDAGGPQALRVVAHAGRVVAESASAIRRLDLDWDAEQHAVLLDWLAELPVAALDDGTTLCRVGNAVVLRRPPSAEPRMESLIADGWISPLAGRLLSQAVGLSRNLLLVGPWATSVELIAALVAEGTLPAVVGTEGDAVPRRWPLLGDAAQALAYGADRVAAWSLDGAALGELLAGCGGVVAWSAAGRIDRALVRLEEATGAYSAQSGPLRILAGLDLIVLLGRESAPRVRQIVEIVIGEQGYQPRVLFRDGLPAAPTALVPVAAPSFLDELRYRGEQVLVDELSHAVGGGAAGQGAGTQSPSPSPGAGGAAPVVPAAAPAPKKRAPEIVSAKPTYIEPTRDDAPPPGWELDQLPEEAVRGRGSDASGKEGADDALMAATFGLGPPPKPPGVTGSSGDAAQERTFAEALQRARERSTWGEAEEDERAAGGGEELESSD